MRLKRSLFLLALLIGVGICLILAVVVAFSSWVLIALGLVAFRNIQKIRRWFRPQSKTLCLRPDGQGEWQAGDTHRGFQVGPQTTVTPFLIALQCQSLLSRRTIFRWIAWDSCSRQDFRTLTLKLKQILSKYESS